MKKLSLYITLVLLPILSYSQNEINLMSFNIRYHNNFDGINSWENRIDKISSQINFYDTDILGIQEGLKDQIDDLVKNLNINNYIGVGRDDGKDQGEFAAIFYNKLKFKLITSGYFWLSQTPDVPSKGWDAACIRICTWCYFQDLKTNKNFYVFNTHLDHEGKTARIESIKLILKNIDSISNSNSNSNPVILMGDFNSDQEDTVIKTIIHNKNKIKLFNSSEVTSNKHYGPTGSFNAFKNQEESDKPIDFIFVSKNFKIIKHAHLSETWHGLFSSDHFPVYVKLKIE